MKKMIALLLAGVLASGVLAGCSQQTQTEVSKMADGAVKIILWRPQDTSHVEKWYDEKIAAFNEANKGLVYLEEQVIIRADSFAYDDKLSAAITSNTLPDIVMLDGPNIATYAANGIIQPLDPYFPETERMDFLDSSLMQNTYDQQLYAIGNTESSVALYYDKDKLDALGIEAPSALKDAWTWSEYYDIAQKLTTPDCKGTRIIMDKGEGLTYVMEQFWLSQGTDIISSDGSTAQGYLNSAEGVKAAQYLNRFIQEGVASIDPLPNEFQNGKAATQLGGCWDISTMENFPELNWGITYFPRSDDGKPTSPTGDWAYSITTGCKAPDAAGAVLQFLTSPENTITFSRTINKPPARKSAFDVMTEYNEYPQSIFKEQLMNSGTPRPRTPVYTILSPKFAQGMMDIFTGADVQSTLDDIAVEVDGEYAYNYKTER